MAAQSQLLTTWAGVLFISGKVVRFLLFFVFLFTVMSASGKMMAYSQTQIIFFFLCYTFIDVLIQTVFRGIYQFRPLVVSGNFDWDLLKPLPSFFRPLFGWADILDAITLVPLTGYIIYYIFVHSLVVDPISLISFFILFINAIIVAFSINLIIASIGILTTEIDYLTWIYRDVEAMARFPTDIYKKWIQTGLTFIIPITVLITIPAKALLGLLSWDLFLVALGVGVIFLFFSLRFWRYALSRYSSASS